MRQMETIGLVAAMSQERDALLRRVGGWKKIALGPFHGHCFKLLRQTCVLVTSGMGIRRAREATRCLVEMATPQLLVSFGIAGAVETNLEIGDVVAAESVCLLEQGALGPLLPLATWPDAARETIVQALTERYARLYAGTAVTTRGSQFVEYQPGEMAHPVLEMETAGIAQVAAEKGIPLLSLRAISDGPRAPLPFNLGEMMDEDANLRVGKMLKFVICHPGIVLQAQQLMRNTSIATDNAAIALIAALSQPAIEQPCGKPPDYAAR
jgi:adenosylhomocysteine nucleosidase